MSTTSAASSPFTHTSMMSLSMGRFSRPKVPRPGRPHVKSRPLGPAVVGAVHSRRFTGSLPAINRPLCLFGNRTYPKPVATLPRHEERRPPQALTKTQSSPVLIRAVHDSGLSSRSDAGQGTAPPASPLGSTPRRLRRASAAQALAPRACSAGYSARCPRGARGLHPRSHASAPGAGSRSCSAEVVARGGSPGRSPCNGAAHGSARCALR